MRELTLGSLKLHDINADIGLSLRTPIEGLESPEYRTTSYDNPGADGTYISNQFYGGHLITLAGRIWAVDTIQYHAKRALLSQACAIVKDANGIPQPKQLSFVTLTGDSYFAKVFIKSRPVFKHENITFCDFMLQLITRESLIFGSSSVTSAAIGIPSGGGFVVPVIGPIVSTGAVGGSMVVNNPGTAAASPIISLVGPLTNPRIANNTDSGKALQLNVTIPNGSTMTIDTGEKTIVMNGSTPYISAKSTDSDWFSIVPGNNTLTFASGATSDTGTAQVSFYPGYLGV